MLVLQIIVNLPHYTTELMSMTSRRTNIPLDRLRSYSSVFSRNVFSAIISYSDYSRLDWLYDIYDKDEHTFSGRTYLDYLSYAYKILVKSYRCEYVYKNELINHLLLKKYGTKHTIAFNEFKVGDSIVDFAMMNGESKAFEIKTALDSPKRLTKQMLDYKLLFNKRYIVVEESMWKYYATHIDNSTGIIVLRFNKGCIHIEELRQATKQTSIDARVLMKCLRTGEYESIIRQYYGGLPQVPSYEMYSACSDLMTKIDSVELNSLFLETVKERKSATERLRIFPKELRQIILALNLSQQKEEELILKLSNTLNFNQHVLSIFKRQTI